VPAESYPLAAEELRDSFLELQVTPYLSSEHSVWVLAKLSTASSVFHSKSDQSPLDAVDYSPLREPAVAQCKQCAWKTSATAVSPSCLALSGCKGLLTECLCGGVWVSLEDVARNL
jgi:hypothetical protein